MPGILSGILMDPRAHFAVGVVAAALVVEIAALRMRAPDQAWALRRWLVAAVIGGLVAGRVVYVIGNAGAFVGRPLAALAFWQGGLSGQAAMVAVILVTAIFLGRTRANFTPTIVAVISGLIVGQGLAIISGPGPGLPDLNYRYETLDGQGFDLGSQFAANRPVVLNLWATWCGPCRRELPMFQEVMARHKDVTFAFASQSEPKDRVALYLVTEDIRLPNVIFDTNGQLGRRYASFGLPTTLFIRPDGAVRTLHVGAISRDRLEAEIAALKSP